MKKRRMVLVLGMIIMIIALSGCPYAVKPVEVPEEKLGANYDKMFEAAINAGIALGYHVEFKDKERGMIKLLKQIMSNNYRITVQFGELKSYGGKKGFAVFGQTKDIVNPFIEGEVQKITDAINKAVENGTSPKESQPTAISPSPPPTATKPEPKKPSIIYLLTMKNSNIRTKPTTKSQIIATIKKGTKIEKISESADWFEVRLPSGKTGHIYKPLVIVIPSPEASTHDKPESPQPTEKATGPIYKPLATNEAPPAATEVPPATNEVSLKTPTKDILVTSGDFTKPYDILGEVECTITGKDVTVAVAGGPPQVTKDIKDLLRKVAFTKYGERVDAIINTKTVGGVQGGVWAMIGSQFGAKTGTVSAYGIAVHFK